MKLLKQCKEAIKVQLTINYTRQIPSKSKLAIAALAD